MYNIKHEFIQILSYQKVICNRKIEIQYNRIIRNLCDKIRKRKNLCDSSKIKFWGSTTKNKTIARIET